MALSKEKIKWVLEYVKGNKDFIEYNEEIFQILEGNLLEKLQATITEQLTGRSAGIMKSRAIPINVLKKIISKLSKLYFEAPERKTENTANQELIDWYTNELSINEVMNNCNESFNSYKNSSIEIIENADFLEVNTRTIPSLKKTCIQPDWTRFALIRW